MRGTGDQMTDGRKPEVMTFGQLAAVIADLKCAPAGENARGGGGTHGKHARCLVVGIDGMSGSGKTEFASRLARKLAAPVLSTDDLVPGWDGLAESVQLLTDWVLRPLAAGRPARWRRYDWLAGRPGEWSDLDPGDFLVVEGCCAGLYPAASYLSYLVWIDAPEAARRRRLERRADWPAYAPFAGRWASQETALQATAGTAQRADLVVDNSADNSAGSTLDNNTLANGVDKGAGTPGGGWRDSFAYFRRVRTGGTLGKTTG